METINVHEAKTHLSRVIDQVVHGETVVIAKAGKPLVKVTRVGAAEAPKRLGFMAGQGSVPDDFDTMGQSEIERLFSATSA